MGCELWRYALLILTVVLPFGLASFLDVLFAGLLRPLRRGSTEGLFFACLNGKDPHFFCSKVAAE